MKVLCLCLTVLFCFSGLAFAGQSLSTKIEAMPTVTQATPTATATAITLGPSRYMTFSHCTGEAACCAILAGKSNQYRPGQPSYASVEGLTLAVPVPQENRTNGSVLVTWTLRVEGKDGAFIDPWHNFCSVWHGSITETFKVLFCVWLYKCLL